MVKRRPVIVVSPKMKTRPGLCTVVALSTTHPNPVEQYHFRLDIRPQLPDWLKSDSVWVKGDMISVVSLRRLDFIQTGKDISGRRQYYYSALSKMDIKQVQGALLSGLGLSRLTKYL